jgi:hypothetical protein
MIEQQVDSSRDLYAALALANYCCSILQSDIGTT